MARVPFLLLPLSIVSCDFSAGDAEDLLARYHDRVSQAYRTGDVRLVEAVVGPNGTIEDNLSPVIASRKGAKLVLDVRPISVEVLRFDRSDPARLSIHTKERWRYRDLKQGSEEPVGEASFDELEIIYRLSMVEDVWVINDLRFLSHPSKLTLLAQATP